MGLTSLIKEVVSSFSTSPIPQQHSNVPPTMPPRRRRRRSTRAKVDMQLSGSDVDMEVEEEDPVVEEEPEIVVDDADDDDLSDNKDDELDDDEQAEVSLTLLCPIVQDLSGP